MGCVSVKKMLPLLCVRRLNGLCRVDVFLDFARKASYETGLACRLISSPLASVG
jgi:hypothetical protein